MSLLEAYTVFSELVTACLLAGAPTSFYPSLVMATTEGVVLLPSAFSITLGVLPSNKATQELVVPRSIPIMGPLAVEAKGWRRRLLKNLNICLLIELNLISTSQGLSELI